MTNPTETAVRRREILLFFSLRVRLMIGVGLLMVGTFAANYVITVYGIPGISLEGSFKNRQSEVFKSLNLTAELKKDRLVRWLREQKSLATLLADDNEIRTGIYTSSSVFRSMLKTKSGRGEIIASLKAEKTYKHVIEHLWLFKNTYGIFDEIEILDPVSQEVIVSTQESRIGEKVSYFSDYYRRMPVYNESHIYIPYDSKNMKHHIHIARPVMPPEIKGLANNPIGLLVLHIHTDDLIVPLIVTGEDLGKTGEVLLVDENKTIMTSLMKPLKDGTKAIPLEYKIEALPVELATRGEEGIIIAEDYRGEQVLAAYRHVRISQEAGWGLVVKRDTAEVFESIYRSQRYVLIITFSAIAILLVMTNFIVTRLTAPIQDLSNAAYQIEEGDLSVRTAVTGAPEVRNLALAFNSMVDRLQNWSMSLETEVKIRTQELEEEIKERKLIERAMEEANRSLSALIEGSPLAIITADPKGRFQSWNPAAERIFGWKAKEVIGRISPMVPEQDREELMEMIRNTLEGNRTLELDVVRLRKDGTSVNVSISTAPVLDEGVPIAAMAIFADITKRKVAEEALLKSEEQYRTLIHSATDAIISTDASGKINSWNRAAEKIFGYPEKEAIGMEITNLMPQSYREAHIQGMERVLETGIEKIIGKTVEVEGLRKNGEQFPVEISLASWKVDDHINFTAIIRDITERQKLEAQIHHTQKLESLGILAGGIAHDFNNLLMGILGNASLALPRVPDDNPAHLNIERIEQAAIRASDLTNQMLAYSGKGKFIVGIMDINEIVEEMSQLLTSSVGKKCGIYYNLSSEPVTVEGSTAQMQQLIMNLITNASDAIGDNKGSITITTGIKEFDSTGLASAYFTEVLPEGMYSFINVSDTGKGMDKETLEKLFDPFYTTKEVGSGLGLAAALGIVRGHWGTIQVESKPDEGANFRILLPYTQPDDAPVKEEKPSDETARWSGSGTVLVVDDEEYVRDVATNILEECGLTVILAHDGAEGLEVFGKMGKEIDLVLLDMTMPEMSGSEVFTELRSIDRNIKVILSSGYAEQEICAEIVDEYGDVEFIQKPYKAAALVEVVRQVID